MNKVYFIIGSIFTTIITYFVVLWIFVFSNNQNREEAIESFYEKVPNVIQNNIDITFLCIILGLVAISCFYLSYKKSIGLLKNINIIFFILSLLITFWYFWTLL